MRHFWLQFWIVTLFLGINAQATMEKAFPFNFHEAPLTKVIDFYSQATGQKFVVDSNLTASVKVTILQPKKVSAQEAFNLLSASLALSGVAISNRDGTYVLSNARNIQRNYISVVNELPALQPERLVTWVITLKHSDAGSLVQQLRILTSKDGEVSSYGANRLVITDWVSNLHRVKDLIDQIDQPAEAKAPPPPPAK